MKYLKTLLNIASALGIAGTLLLMTEISSRKAFANKSDKSKAQESKSNKSDDKDSNRKMDRKTYTKTMQEMEAGEYAAVSGKVFDLKSKYFILLVDDEKIRVEISENERNTFKKRLMTDHQIVVGGIIKENFFTKNSLNPNIIYLKDSGEYIYRDKYMERSVRAYLPKKFDDFKEVPKGSFVNIYGKVVDFNEKELTIATGERKVSLELSKELEKDRSNLRKKISSGDFIRVNGKVNKKFYTQNKIKADEIEKIIK